MNRFLYIGLFLFIEAVLIGYLAWTNTPFMTISPDGQLYYNLAENVASGNGLINTVRQENIIVPPFFALVIAPFVFFFHAPEAYMVFQYIVYGLNGVFLACVGAKLFQSRAAGVWSAVLYAVHPVLLLNGPQFLLTETLFVTFLLTVVYLVMRLFEKEKKNGLFAALLFVLSLSLLYRPHLLYVFILVFGLWVLFAAKKKMRIWSIAFFAIPVVLLGLNGLYNQSLHGTFVTLENYSGQNLYIANNPETKVDFYASTRLSQFVEPEYFEYEELTLSERSSVLKEKAFSYILADPLAMVERMVLKMGLFFKGIFVIDTITLVLALAGMILAFWKSGMNKWMLSFFVLYIVGFAAMTSLGLLVGGQRYRAPIVPVYLLFAGYVLGSVSLFIKKRKTKEIR
ncbi:glycosyltransferase family 39 protein [Domibacillus iocasae]|uniref:Glycosyltransferase RgtA/B/C/D-like domain-containing protein n=1 Tax=Domibacillus iocasae TaxID=1714016 RepID=A0A1E7DPH8_9BACI|nr:glycosyltransferase family 39 protein [Domibacillus iocasae]OES44963.1 hypothetical protein BA724_06785 [Domibacillus iocasae]